MKYLIIGSGRMAIGVVHDLLNLEYIKEVHVTDREEAALEQMNSKFKDDRLHTYKIDADDKDRIIPLMGKVNGVLSAVPYDYNLGLTEWSIESGSHFVDLGGNFRVVKEQFKLDQKARNAGVGIIPDCGLAPGMASVVAAHAIGRLDSVDTLEIRVGGLPVERKTPLNYQLIFSVHGLTNEYIEPSIILDEGKIKTVPSMTEIESLDFPEPFGKLEAFYTSGGTSTLPMTYQGEINKINYKTIRYPGHCERFKMMIDLGFIDEKPMDIQGKSISRRVVFERLLEETLTFEGEDVTLMRVSAQGMKDGVEKRWDYQAIEYEDKENNLTAMMRTTAFPAIITLEMLVDGRIKDKGVLCQELSIPPDLFLQELEKRNIHFEVSD
ncbi:MAG: saccharopine dehydrogenase NADP-binding domain-containing protein [Calditrichia bacterium]|nr:saccharopine dehydrogenase NADP-binding domain-containing protein [Calditrichia bacterium]